MQVQVDQVLSQVATVISPVWPLKDYVAVNPYFGMSDRSFLDSRSLLQRVSDCETLMPLSYYNDQYAKQQFSNSDIELAIFELGLSDQVQADAVIAALNVSSVNTNEKNLRLRTISEFVDSKGTSNWTVAIRDEVSKFCAAHYDEGQAVWKSPWKGLSLFNAWRSMSLIDRNMESNGLKGFRDFVGQLPETADQAIAWLLQKLGLPEELWESFLLCQAFSMPGWSAWAKYQTHWTDEAAADRNDFNGLLAIRLAYDVAVGQWANESMDWDSLSRDVVASAGETQPDDTTCRYVLLRASEIAFRDNLLGTLSNQNHEPIDAQRKLAQLVFCIDVRSERMRRQLESQSPEIETFGFAGFFGMPIEFVPMGQSQGVAHLPVLLKPQFKLHEGLHEADTAEELACVEKRIRTRSWRKLWKRFQTSSIGCFTFVETVGFFYGWKLLKSAIGMGSKDGVGKFDGVEESDQDLLGPTLRGLNQQGMTTSNQIDLAKGMLTNLGLTKDFAKLVVFCGHASQTENNPLAAGLDCGACGGHSGEPNARLAAALLNQPFVRSGLVEHGIQIPEDTHFLGGLHNTTTDKLSFFDLDEMPTSHREELSELVNHAAVAGKQTRTERMPIVASKTMRDVMRRAVDWSEVRPEWGLAGNAAFIVGPRSMTKQANLDGRSFLHSYDFRNDPDGAVLEGIMTAPMVVANWINMQYYASTVDNDHFGSGSKTVHNVVGRFGVLSGNSGDLMTGLPIQSLHNGNEYQHLPMRLQCIIAAPRESIDRIIAKHELVQNLLDNEWLHLIAIEDGISYRYANSGWHIVTVSERLAV
jgi:uncharacterized protein YbcC (UPF0753/DUF2309 family)